MHWLKPIEKHLRLCWSAQTRQNKLSLKSFQLFPWPFNYFFQHFIKIGWHLPVFQFVYQKKISGNPLKYGLQKYFQCKYFFTTCRLIEGTSPCRWPFIPHMAPLIRYHAPTFKSTGLVQNRGSSVCTCFHFLQFLRDGMILSCNWSVQLAQFICFCTDIWASQTL